MINQAYSTIHDDGFGNECTVDQAVANQTVYFLLNIHFAEPSDVWMGTGTYVMSDQKINGHF